MAFKKKKRDKLHLPEDIRSYIWEQLHTNQLDNVSVSHYSHKKILNWSQKKTKNNPLQTFTVAVE